MKLTLNANDLSKLARKIERELVRSGFPVMATTISEQQDKRNARGVDSDEVRFKPYVPGYASDRRRHGYSVKPVTLERTGAYKKKKYYDKSTQTLTVKESVKPIAEGLSKKRTHLLANAKDIPLAEKACAKKLEEVMNG